MATKYISLLFCFLVLNGYSQDDEKAILKTLHSELDYDNYKDLDVTGKILLMETGLPYNANDNKQ